jgi:hypothetical protein
MGWKVGEIKRCPFCGFLGSTSPLPYQQENGLWMMECRSCGANGPKEKTRDAAHIAWDVRHRDSEGRWVPS